jgi:hypothetical protein
LQKIMKGIDLILDQVWRVNDFGKLTEI